MSQRTWAVIECTIYVAGFLGAFVVLPLLGAFPRLNPVPIVITLGLISVPGGRALGGYAYRYRQAQKAKQYTPARLDLRADPDVPLARGSHALRRLDRHGLRFELSSAADAPYRLDCSDGTLEAGNHFRLARGTDWKRGPLYILKGEALVGRAQPVRKDHSLGWHWAIDVAPRQFPGVIPQTLREPDGSDVDVVRLQLRSQERGITRYRLTLEDRTLVGYRGKWGPSFDLDVDEAVPVWLALFGVHCLIVSTPF